MRYLLLAGLVTVSACSRQIVPPTETTTSVPAPGLELRGIYQVTFDADSACPNLPEQARSRTYWASFQPTGTMDYLGTLSGADFATSSMYPNWNVVYARASADTAHLFFSDPPIWEHLTRATDQARETDLLIDGDAQGHPDGSRWPFAGRFTYCPSAEPDDYLECRVPEIACRSSNHHLTLTRTATEDKP